MNNINYNNKFIIIMIVIIFILCAIGMHIDNKRETYVRSIQNKLIAAEEKLALTVENLQLECEKSDQLAAELDSATKSLDLANNTISDLKNTNYELVYMGEFKLTHYCTEVYPHICGTGTGITATGTKVTSGRSVAVDPTVIPYGSKLYIEGYGFRTAEDTGGAINGKHIDIAVDTHSEAESIGIKSGGVWVLVNKNY